MPSKNKIDMIFINSIIEKFQKPKSDMEHSKKPFLSHDKQAALAKAKMKEIMASAYYQHILLLKEMVVGKTVSKSLAGTSGFTLYFPDDDWVVSYLHEMNLTWKIGKGNPGKDIKALMNSPEYGDGYQPLPVNRPYANQVCDISAEIANAHGKVITSVSFGARSFNFCFPDGMELDTTIVPTSDEKYALRVFWERW